MPFRRHRRRAYDRAHDRVGQLLSFLPVRDTRPLSPQDRARLSAEICRHFDIDITADDAGAIEFGGRGLEVPDQPLLLALQNLIDRRFGAVQAR